jgi:hypothetical protein
MKSTMDALYGVKETVQEFSIIQVIMATTYADDQAGFASQVSTNMRNLEK